MCTSSELSDCIYVKYEKICSAMEKRNGAQGRDRTTDTMIFSHVLYQLSYLGIAPAAVLQDRRAVGVRAYAERASAWQGGYQSSSRMTSSGAAGGPGTA